MLTVLFLTSLAAPAQQTDTELLRVIACELRELRAVIHRGLVSVPLVEANVRERVQIQARISELEEKRSGIDQKVQEVTNRQAEVRESRIIARHLLSTLPNGLIGPHQNPRTSTVRL